MIVLRHHAYEPALLTSMYDFQKYINVPELCLTIITSSKNKNFSVYESKSNFAVSLAFQRPRDVTKINKSKGRNIIRNTKVLPRSTKGV